MAKLPLNAALLVVDVQNGFDDPIWGRRNNPTAEDNILRLLARWRATRRPVVHIQHMSTSPQSPLRPGQPGNNLKAGFEPHPGEPLIRKQVNSAFVGTDLEERLRTVGIQTLVIVGLTTDHCVSTTTRMGANLGFEPWVVSDDSATFDRTDVHGTYYPAQTMHNVNLASLHGEFATVADTDQVVRRL